MQTSQEFQAPAQHQPPSQHQQDQGPDRVILQPQAKPELLKEEERLKEFQARMRAEMVKHSHPPHPTRSVLDPHLSWKESEDMEGRLIQVSLVFLCPVPARMT